MPISKYFLPSKQYNEQRLIEDLFVECIQLFGTEAFYLPRDPTIDTTDLVYGEDPTKVYTTNYPIEIYNTDTTDFQGQREVFSKFGIELKLEYTVLISRKSFLQRVAQNNLYMRPIEGDLLWIPHVRGHGLLYEITFVNPESDMFMLGRQFPYYWQLKMEPFKYSQEIIQVGLPSVDAIPGMDAYTLSFLLSSANSQGQYITLETVYQGSNLETSTASAFVSYWDNPTLTLNVTNITGTFTTNANVVGSLSNAMYNLVSFDPLQDNLIREVFDNLAINTEGNSYMDISEKNPLGNPD